MDAFHPDHLRPGSMVGPWRILKPLGRGGMGRVFQVEHEGQPFLLKMALRPGTEEGPQDEEHVDRRLGREAAFYLSQEALPGVLRVVEVSRWPLGPGGFRTLVTEYVEGETFHEWRWRTRPSAAKLLDVYEGLVRTVAELHRRNIHHRDVKAENILIRARDEQPLLIDFGLVSLPGAATLTTGGLVGTLYTMLPEALAFFRSEAWRTGARFHGGPAGDLYALGVLLYEALTDCFPFDPRLPPNELVAAIETAMPPAPHELVPGVPLALSQLAMRLLAKAPEARPASAEVVLQSLQEARKSSGEPAWQVPLPTPPEELGRRRMRAEEALAEQELPEGELDPKEQSQEARAGDKRSAGVLRNAWAVVGLLWVLTPRRVRWGVALAVSLLLAVCLAWATLTPPHQEGSNSVPTRDSWLSRPLVLLCAVTSLGCPGAQVKPPPIGERCPDQARQFMFEELQITPGSRLRANVDIMQPGTQADAGTYREGPVTGSITRGEGNLPVGTVLRGRLWAPPGIYTDTIPPDEAVIVRYTEAILPDGREGPVCIVLGGPDGRVPKVEGSTTEAVILPRQLPANAVRRWP